ncbi:sugar kinase [Pseudonocardia broussonetiae]|uniref:Sugar kinase n=1 Tax=Pseudonocardia broussonetiae TaxID=2736640 RepID=A0A6M6JJR3_9PSEU|nr:PfkB family carbohydrate kinase [Pseudonocardia broussonetiae]QJY47626.1 sugar kinase [Pseudonocardia broussonetiae]
MRVVHVGSVVVDLVADVPALPPPGGDVLATALRPTPGGGFNLLAAVARQGVEAVYAGPHGTGPFGDLVRAALAAEGVTVVGVPRAVDTGLVVTLVDATGERTFVTSPEAAVGVTADDLARVLPAPGDVVSVSGYGLLHPASRDALVAWVTALPPDVVVACDPGPLAPSAAPDALDAVLARADWCSAAAGEVAAILASRGLAATVSGSPAEAAAHLAVRTDRGVVLRAGAAGCVVVAPGAEPVTVPGFPVEPVDTTGAGDTHTGVFLAGLLRGADPVAAARTANAAAALSVTRRGPATSPTTIEVTGFLGD